MAFIVRLIFIWVRLSLFRFLSSRSVIVYLCFLCESVCCFLSLPPEPNRDEPSGTEPTSFEPVSVLYFPPTDLFRFSQKRPRTGPNRTGFTPTVNPSRYFSHSRTEVWEGERPRHDPHHHRRATTIPTITGHDPHRRRFQPHSPPPARVDCFESPRRTSNRE